MAAEQRWKIPRPLPTPIAEKEEDKRDYRPKVVSIGPLFYGEGDLALAQNFKSVAVDLFVEGGHGSKEFYLEKIHELEGIQDLYDENSVRDKDFFTKMMLNDAALIIIYMEIITRMEMDPSVVTTPGKFDKMKEHLGMVSVGIMARDLFLLQNQIPLAVIDLLVDLRYGPGKVEELLDRFLNKIFREEDHKIDIPCAAKEDKIEFREEDHKIDISSAAKEDKRPRPRPPLHLLEAYHRLIISDFVRIDISEVGKPEIVIPKPFHSFRSATDLMTKGIHFQPIPNRSSKYINFKSHFFFATLQLPSWAIGVHTKVLLKNMVAYEVSPGSPSEGEVLSYVNFMKSLVDRPEDVKVLREKGIISNLLGNDEDAATILNEINTYGLDNSKFFGKVERQIQDHCKRRVNLWIAELLHSSFRSPWTITAFLAALAVLTITAAQLYYAVHPPAN